MSKEYNTPQLRFPGFEGEWEEKTLKEVSSKINKRNSQLEYTRVLTNSANVGVVDQNEYFDRDIAVKENTSNYHVVELNDFVYNPRISTAAPVGPISINKTGRGIMSPLYTVFRFHTGYIPFFEQYFQTTIWHQYLKSIANFGARFDRMNINTEGFFNMPLFIPSPEEQKKIADCLEEIDKLISAQGEKVDALKEKKKGLMQQLFPQQGETTPRLRFPGFEGEWEEKRLSECLDERNEQFPEDSRYPLMAFVAGKGVSPKGEKYDRSALVKDATNKKYKRTELGDFIYSSNNLEAGSIGFNKYGSACISPVYSIFKSKNNVDPVFIGTLLTQRNFISEMIKYRQGVVYGQWKIPETEFLKMRIYVPSPEEQKKIAYFLSEMDESIASESAKLDALKDHKKGLMQQLFPQLAK